MRLLAVLGVCASLLRADSYPRQPGIDAQHYIFRVSLADGTSEISGETTAVIRFVREGVKELSLDLADAMSVSRVTDGSVPVSFVHQNNRLRLALDAAPKAGERREFTIRYQGTPDAGLRFLQNKYGERCIFSMNWPELARHWLPAIDHPYDKATGEFVVTAPARYQVVANGRLIEEIDLGGDRRTTHWKQSVPIATWLYNIGVARFASRTFADAGGIPLQTWVYPQDREAAIGSIEDAERRAMEFFTARIGPYPYEKLAVVEAAGFQGAMEHASAIFLGESGVNGKTGFGIVAHEIAHQWFGDSVTEKDWDDVWLSEGFATYFALLATEHYEGREAFAAGLKKSRERVLGAEKRLPGMAVFQEKPWAGIPNRIVYEKGGWVLHLLRGEVGAEKFWSGMREYYRRYRDENASSADFERVMEEVSGTDLAWFFRQWLYRPGSPVLQGGWRYEAAAQKLVIELEQTQAGEAYRMPLEIGMDGKLRKIEMNRRQQRFELPVPGQPANVELDPEVSMLMDARFGKL